jgi:hypothetical protein
MSGHVDFKRDSSSWVRSCSPPLPTTRGRRAQLQDGGLFAVEPRHGVAWTAAWPDDGLINKEPRPGVPWPCEVLIQCCLITISRKSQRRWRNIRGHASVRKGFSRNYSSMTMSRRWKMESLSTMKSLGMIRGLIFSCNPPSSCSACAAMARLDELPFRGLRSIPACRQQASIRWG